MEHQLEFEITLKKQPDKNYMNPDSCSYHKEDKAEKSKANIKASNGML